eukprot:scaffold176759_cov62-Attheya_sp.AAC.3
MAFFSFLALDRTIHSRPRMTGGNHYCIHIELLHPLPEEMMQWQPHVASHKYCHQKEYLQPKHHQQYPMPAVAWPDK